MTRCRIGSVTALVAIGLAAPVVRAQVASRPSTIDASARLDTAAIVASARPEIEAANAAWFPAMQRHDAIAIAAAYADSGLFIASDGTVTRGREAVARMYSERFKRLRPVNAGAVIQGGLTVLGPSRIAEWGRGWLEMAAERAGAPAGYSEGTYVTIWQRGADGHWRIIRNLTF